MEFKEVLCQVGISIIISLIFTAMLVYISPDVPNWAVSAFTIIMYFLALIHTHQIWDD